MTNEWSLIISALKDIGIVAGLIWSIWRIAKWFGVIETKIDNIDMQINNHLPTEIKELGNRIDKIDDDFSDKIIGVHERINEHDKEVGAIKGRLSVS